MAEGEPKTSRPPSEWLLGLTGGGYGQAKYLLKIFTRRGCRVQIQPRTMIDI